MKNKKNLIILIFCLISFILIVLVIIRTLSPAGSWICQDGQWIKQGNPRGPMPTEPCLPDSSAENDLNYFSFKIGRPDPDIQSVRTYAFGLPKYMAYEMFGEDASSGYLDFKINDKIVFRLLTVDYVRDKTYIREKETDAYAISFVGGHTNILKVFDAEALEQLNFFIETFEIDGQKVFTADGIIGLFSELEKTGNIIIDKPKPNDLITSPYIITGQARAWYFEASFPIRLEDKQGQIISTSIAYAQDDWMIDDFAPFIAEIEFLVDEETEAVLVLMKDNPSGLLQYDEEVRIPVLLSPLANMNIKAFFGNSQLDPDFSCYKVFPVERKIAKTSAVARAALEELLKGVNEKEEKDGFFTSINSGVIIQKLAIENGVAYVDFNEQLESSVGGSCNVLAIRAQITETLKQFSTVDDVVISINGRTEDILQP